MRLRQLLKEDHEVYRGNTVIGNKDIEDGHFPDYFADKKMLGLFDCSNVSNLTSLVNSPYSIIGICHLEFCEKLTSLEHGPMEVGYLYNYGCPIKSLSGIGKRYLRVVNDWLYLPDTILDSIIGLTIIKNLKGAVFDNDNSFASNLKLRKAVHIWITEFQNLNYQQRDPMEFHEALTRAGLKEYAKL
jgi:hypothetical protein